MNIGSSTHSVLMTAMKNQPLARQVLPDSSSTSTSSTTSDINSSGSASGSAASDFLAFMKQSPEQQMQTAWLARHGISKEQFAAMDPAAKQKIIEQMKNEMKEQARNTAKDSARGSVANMLA